MKPQFNLRVSSRPIRGNPSTKAEAEVIRKSVSDKSEQLAEAVAWCKENNARGQAALRTGQFPLVKDRETINRRLDNKIINGQERSYCTILTHDEEECVVTYLKNKNRCMQAVNKKELEKMILDILRIRKYSNARFKGGRKYQKLSNNAMSALEKGKLSRSFWLRFNAKHKSLTIKRQGKVSINRALNCTRQMACEHLDALAQELIDAGIMTDSKQVEEGIWNGNIDTSRIFNCDETPQFINYGVDGTATGLVYAGRGDACQRIYRENRECVTIQPFVSLAGIVHLFKYF